MSRFVLGFLVLIPPLHILSYIACDEEVGCCCAPLFNHPFLRRFEMVIAAAVVELTASHQRSTLF